MTTDNLATATFRLWQLADTHSVRVTGEHLRDDYLGTPDDMPGDPVDRIRDVIAYLERISKMKVKPA